MATEKALRAMPGNWLKQYLGIKEGSTEHKAILAVLNNSKLCTRYTMTVSDAWCATAVSSAFIACGLADIFPCVECSCANMITLAKNNGIWEEDDSYTPGIGDCIMYDWQDSGKGDNTGTPDHVGIVTAVSDGKITVIEGNKSDTVAYRTMEVNGKYIRGYVTPDFESMATSDSASSTATTTTLAAGTKIALKDASLYTTAAASKASNTVSGTYYIWNATVRNNCIRVTTTSANVGKKDKVTGWVNVSNCTVAANSTSTSSDSSAKTSSASTATKKATKTAKSGPDSSIAGTYVVTATSGLNVRNGAGTGYSKMVTIPKGTKVKCYGYYTLVGSSKWLYIQFTYNGIEYTGHASGNLLKKQ